MAYRTAHGSGADALVRVETLPADELPEGLPAPSGQGNAPAPGIKRTADGRMADRQAAAELGRRGALAMHAKRRARRPAVLEALGLRGIPPSEMVPYLDMANDFAEHETARLAQTVGGGHCGSGPASMIQSAALALAASRYLYAQGNPETMGQAARLADSSKQQILTAFELTAREAKARAEQPGQEDDVTRALREMGSLP